MTVHVSKTTQPGGFWNLYVDGVDRTFFRGMPVQIGQIADTDPFGPSTAQFTLTQVSPLEPIGDPGTDLEWLRPDNSVEIVYTVDPSYADAADLAGFGKKYYWRGFINSFGFSSQQGNTQVTVDCVGALRVLNNILAMDEQVPNPLSYEAAIAHAVNNAITRLGPKAGPMRDMAMNIDVFGKPQDKLLPEGVGVVWNAAEWARKYPDEPWMIPEPGSVTEGELWSGMLTRDMGKNDKTLSSYVDGMLKVMYTPAGRFSIRLAYGTWQPELYHVNLPGYARNDESKVIHIDAAWPGVSFDLNHDYSQMVTTVYGNAAGTSVDGSNYTGEQFTASGTGTWFKPFADSRRAQDDFMRRETFMQFNDGLAVEDAIQVSNEHISRNIEPGYTGSITLTLVDPKIYDTTVNFGTGGELLPFPHQFLQAGMTVRLHGFHGSKQGITLFVTETSHDVTGNSVTLQVDTKFRDYLTVKEVLNRGRDAMAPIRLMTPGTYSPSAADRLRPWDPATAGFMPQKSNALWNTPEAIGDPSVDEDDATFPWDKLTERYPPKDYPQFYVKIAAKTGPYPRGKSGEPLSPELLERFWSSSIYNGPWEKVPYQRRRDPVINGEVQKYGSQKYPDYLYANDGKPDVNGDLTKPDELYTPDPGDILVGNPIDIKDEDGNIVEAESLYFYQQTYDDDGNPNKDENGNFVYDWVEVRVGDNTTPPTKITDYRDQSKDPNWSENQTHVELAAKGTITAVRMMCVNAEGRPLPVTYHLSLWSVFNALGDFTPQLPGNYPEYFNENKNLYFPDFVDTGTRFYETGGNYPFYPYAWEDRLPDGSQYGQEGAADNVGRKPSGEGLLKAFGSYWARPGTFPWQLGDPGSWDTDGPKWKGYFSDDTAIPYTMRLASDGVRQDANSQVVKEGITASFLIFCDDLPTEDKYFIGRLYSEQRGRKT